MSIDDFPCVTCAWRRTFYCNYHRQEMKNLEGCPFHTLETDPNGRRIMKILYKYKDRTY